MISSSNPDPMTIEQALLILDLTEPFSPDALQKQYEEARRIWYPSRYAGLTNNPAKYMEMYKKGEAKTKEIHAAYQILSNHLLNSCPSEQQDDHGAA
ncbi:MAG: hypothetical protein KIT39_16600 [Nitrospirales bacterium]|nr:hypothetical protein [Nitrospirales bacterium]